MLENIQSAIRTSLIKILQLDPDVQIKPYHNLKEDLGLDSMSSLTFLMSLEEAIDGFVVNPNTLDADALATVETISHYVMTEIMSMQNTYEFNRDVA